MRKLKLLFAACALMMGAGQTWGQTDVTSTYLTNAGFETDGSKDATTTPTGWTLASSSGSYTSYRPINKTSTPNGSKTVSNGSSTGAAEGSCYLYLRTNWGSGTIDLTQVTSTALPVGHYVLKADILQPYTTTGMPTFTLSAKDGSTSLASVSITNEAPTWKTFSVEFDLSEATSVTVDLYHATGTGNGDGCMSLVDNIRLIQYNYSTLQTLISEAETLYDESGTDASTFSSAITTAKTITSSDATATITAAIETLENAIDTYKAAQFTAPDDTNYSSWITNYTLDTTTGGTVFDTQGTVWNSNIPSGWSVARNSSAGINTTTVSSGQSGSGFETWTGNTTAFMTLYQSISSLPAGQYTLAAYMQKGGKFFVQNGDNDPVYSTECSADSWTQYSVTFIKENDDDAILIGVVPSHLASSTFGQYDEFSLTCNGVDVSALKTQIASLQAEAVGYLADADYTNVTGTERTDLTTQSTAIAASNTVTAYNTLLSNVQDAINAFTSAKTNYDANAAEVTKATALGVSSSTISTYTAGSTTTAATALTNTQNLKVAEYNYVTDTYEYGVSLGEWTSTGTNTSAATFNNEHWSGTTHDYKNQKDDWGTPKQGYAASSWSINFSQNVALPAGNYVFKVAGRQASGDKVTTSLVVTKTSDSSVLGTVSDFPRSNNARGINTSGVTDFATGEGHTYANSGNGYGWEWRYVKFTLAEDATVNIAISSVATDYSQWVSFGDYTLQTDDATNISLIAYNIALNSAQTVIADGTYSNVTGSEKTALQDAINADESLNKSDADAIDAATAALDAAREAFVAAKSAYDAFVAAKAVAYEDNLPYASSTKFDAIGTAQEATATSASDATSKTAAIISAYRKYVESNAMGEGVSATDKTSLISDPNMDVTYDGTAHTFGAWQVIGQTDGTIQLLSGESFTDGDGNSNYKYADIYKSDNNAGIQQTIFNLAPGRYLLTVTARAQATASATFGLFAGDTRTEITRIGNSGGVFDRGWNDVSVEFVVYETSDVNIGVQSGNGKSLWWSATRFRLVRLGDAIENITVSDAGFATYVSDNDLNYSGVTGLKAYKATVAGNTITFSPVTTVPAGEGVLLRGAGDTYSVPVTAGVAAWDAEDNAFIRGTGAAVETGSGPYNYILNKVNGVIGFYRANNQIVATNRAYLQTTTNAARLNISFDDDDQTTGIARVEETVANDAVYTLSGVRVEKPTKGLYIKNGKKVVIK